MEQSQNQSQNQSQGQAKSQKDKYVDILALLSLVDFQTRKLFVEDLMLYGVCCFDKDDTGKITRVSPTVATSEQYMAYRETGARA